MNRVHANVENATTSETFVDYSHNDTNHLVTKKTCCSDQKLWVKGRLDEAGLVNLGAGPVAVKGESFSLGLRQSSPESIQAC